MLVTHDSQLNDQVPQQQQQQQQGRGMAVWVDLDNNNLEKGLKQLNRKVGRGVLLPHAFVIVGAPLSAPL
eukprot:126954-Pelagomonas_calceolata.AAC.1